jgi:hypothetical protein
VDTIFVNQGKCGSCQKLMHHSEHSRILRKDAIDESCRNFCHAHSDNPAATTVLLSPPEGLATPREFQHFEEASAAASDMGIFPRQRLQIKGYDSFLPQLLNSSILVRFTLAQCNSGILRKCMQQPKNCRILRNHDRIEESGGDFCHTQTIS